jgi:DNA-repair protein XRCC3
MREIACECKYVSLCMCVCVHHCTQFIENVSQEQYNLEKLVARIERLLLVKPVRLIVIDSMAGLFRECDGDYAARSKHMFALAGALQRISAQRKCPVVVTNQVSDVFDGKKCTDTSEWSVRSSGKLVTPALGMAWSNCITSRTFLSRVSRHGGTSSSAADAFDAPTSQGRRLHRMFSPRVPPKDPVSFGITEEGVYGVE